MSVDIEEQKPELPSPAAGAGRVGSIIARLKRRFPYGLILGVAVIAAVTLASNGPALAGMRSRCDWRLMPIVIGLTLANYLLRFGKW